MTSEKRKSKGYSYSIVQEVRSADPMHIGVQLGRLCIEKNIPVSKVAEDTGVSRLTVYMWFTGKTYPKPERKEKLQALLAAYEYASV